MSIPQQRWNEHTKEGEKKAFFCPFFVAFRAALNYLSRFCVHFVSHSWLLVFWTLEKFVSEKQSERSFPHVTRSVCFVTALQDFHPYLYVPYCMNLGDGVWYFYILYEIISSMLQVAAWYLDDPPPPTPTPNTHISQIVLLIVLIRIVFQCVV